MTEMTFRVLAVGVAIVAIAVALRLAALVITAPHPYFAMLWFLVAMGTMMIVIELIAFALHGERGSIMEGEDVQ